MADYYSKAIDLMKIDSAYVIGWSDEGEAALLLAKNRPDKIKKIAVSEASYKLEGAKKEEVQFWHMASDTTWVAKNMQGWIQDYTKKSPTGNWKRYVTEARKMWFEEIYFPKSVLESITIPTLVIYGDRDVYTM